MSKGKLNLINYVYLLYVVKRCCTLHSPTAAQMYGKLQNLSKTNVRVCAHTATHLGCAALLDDQGYEFH